VFLLFVEKAVRPAIRCGLIVLLLVTGIFGWKRCAMAQAVRKEPIVAPAVDEVRSAAHRETAVFAGGCFWGVRTV